MPHRLEQALEMAKTAKNNFEAIQAKITSDRVLCSR
jgi:hypothetical protein